MSERKTVTENTIYETMRAVVAERPDHVYSPPEGEGEGEGYEAGMCLYVHGDKPGCVVGVALHRLGVPLAELSKHEGRPANSVLGEFFAVVGDASRAGRYLCRAQENQDDGMPWGEALACAERYLPGQVVV